MTREGSVGDVLAVLAGFVVLSETRIVRHLRRRWRRWRRWRRRNVRGLAGVDAGYSLALSDECGGAFVGNDLKIVWSTGV